MSTNHCGVLSGIGVGPGEPELLTLKALRLIEGSDIIVLPSAPKEECYAYRIVEQAYPAISHKEIVCKPFPMTRDAGQLAQAHDRIYRELADMLHQGKNVAFLTIGDASLYSTFGYISKRAIAEGIPTQVVAGVPSFCAVAARLGIPLADADEPIHIISGQAPLADSLALNGTRIFMKTGRQLARLKQLLSQKPTAYEVHAVSNCGLPYEKIMHGIDELDTTAGYLTVVIVKKA